MNDILFKAFSYMAIIAIGYTLKKIGLFGPRDHDVVSRIMLNVTLPAAVITSFASFSVDMSLLVIFVFGLASNLMMLLLGYLASRRSSIRIKALFMINFPGYNIGTFTLPFVQNFLGPLGVVATCLFDTGNTIMVTGGSYAVTSRVVGSEVKQNLRGSIRTLLSSVPFDTYMTMLILSLLNIRLPQPVISFTSIVGSANGFIAMLMIGMMFEIHFDSAYLRPVLAVLFSRYAFATVLALALYHLTPFSLDIRQTLAIIVFAPVSTLAPVFTARSKGNAAQSSLIGSLSMAISMIIITGLLLVMKTG